MEVELRQTNNIIPSGWMDGTVIAQRTNTSAFTSGTIMLGLMDVDSRPSLRLRATPSHSSTMSAWKPCAADSIHRYHARSNGHVVLTLSSALGDSFQWKTSTNPDHLATARQPDRDKSTVCSSRIRARWRNISALLPRPPVKLWRRRREQRGS